jgi:phytoene dehydrogenase-like protein
VVYEAGDGPGGRVRTDVVDGFRLDRGFQILLTAYPECQEVFDYDRLDLRTFQPGALVRIGDSFHRVGDPLREPRQLPATIAAPIGSPIDKARIVAYRLRVARGSIDDMWDGIGTTAIHRFEKLGFSSKIIERFLRPLFAGITLDPELQGSSQIVDFVFRMLSAGDAAIPAQGMGVLSDQLAGSLPEGTVHYAARVEQVTASTIAVTGADEAAFDAVIIATDASESARLADTEDPGWNGVTSLWISSPIAPIDQPVLALNGTGHGAINSMAPMSHVSGDYAPPGQHLFVVSAPTLDPDAPAAMRRQLVDWFGPVADTYAEVRVDRIEKAQPKQLPGHDARAAVESNGLFLAGDHRRDASLNGAIGSGRAAARAALGR